MPITNKIQVRRGFSTVWTSVNPILLAGEIGFESDSRRIKIGNGTSTWTTLPYVVEALLTDAEKTKLAGIQAAAQVNAVTTVFGRTGAIAATAGDYTADKITDVAAKVIMTSAERTKLAGIATAADVNVVNSVFGRIGAVAALTGDYTADKVTDTASKVLMTVSERTKLAGLTAGSTTVGVGNGVTDDSAAFATFESSVTNHVFDLFGKTYRVTSIPTGNRYVNGYFRIINADEGVSIDYPMPDTLPRSVSILDTGSMWALACQGGGLLNYRGVLHLRYMSGTGHAEGENDIVTAASYDGGHSFRGFKLVKPIVATGMASLTAGIFDGQQFIVVREGAAPWFSRLMGRRLYERREGLTVLVSTTSGSPNVLLKFSAADGFRPFAGLQVGNRIRITSGNTVGGIALLSTQTIVQTGSYVRYVASSNATSTVTDQSVTMTIDFLQDDFAEVLIGGQSLSDALTAFTGLGSVANFSGYAMLPGTLGSIYLAVKMDSVSYFRILRINGLFTSAPAFDWLRSVAGITEVGGESHFVRLPTGQFVGCQRALAMRFWYSPSDSFTGTTVWDMPSSFGRDCTPDLQLDGDTLHIALTGDRIRTTAGPVGLYYGSCNVNDFITSGPSIISWRWLKDLYHDPDMDDGGGSPTGQPCMALLDSNTICMAYVNTYPNVSFGYPNDQTGPFGWQNSNGQSNVEVMTLNLGSRGEVIPTYVDSYMMAPFRRKFVIDAITPLTAGLATNYSHNLWIQPDMVQLKLNCLSADAGWLVGNVIDADGSNGISAQTGSAFTCTIRIKSTGVTVFHKTTMVSTVVDPTKWSLTVIFRA